MSGIGNYTTGAAAFVLLKWNRQIPDTSYEEADYICKSALFFLIKNIKIQKPQKSSSNSNKG